MKFKFSFIALLLLALLTSPLTAAEKVKYRLVMQVSEDSVDRLVLALKNAEHVQEQFGPENVEVQIVAFGGGIETLKYYSPIPVADKVREAKHEGVRIVVCDYSMRARKLKPAEMLPEIGYVPSGVAEIMERVQEGWIYIRP